MALVKVYFEKTKHYQAEYGDNTVVLMQVGAFFEIYGLENKATGAITGSKISDLSRICDLNIADKKMASGDDTVIMAGFSHYMIDKYLKKLQGAGYTIAVYVQDEQAKNTTRSLQGIYSPGTYFSPDTTKITNNTTCIWVQVETSSILQKTHNRMVRIGLANIDIYTGKSSIFEFSEIYINNPTTFDELERFISIYCPCEVIIIGNVSYKELDDILNYSNVQCKTIHKICLLVQNSPLEQVKRAFNSEKQTYQKELLEKFYELSNIDSDVFLQNFYQNVIATQAFCFLLDFIYQHNPNLVYKISEPKFENVSDRLILANHSLKQLNIIDDHNSSGKYASVEKMLNICITSMGKRRFSYNLLNPSINVEYLQREYDITEHMLSKYTQYEYLKNKLVIIKDISKLNRQIYMKKISPKSLCQLYNNLHDISSIFNEIMATDPILYEYFTKTVHNFAEILQYCDDLRIFLNTHFNISMCGEIDITGNFDENFIHRGIDAELDAKTALHLESNDKLESIRQYLNMAIMKYEKSTSASIKNVMPEYVKIHETEKNNFSLIATKRRCNILKQIFESSPPAVDNNAKKVSLQYVSSYSGESKMFDFYISKTHIEFYSQTASNECIAGSQITDLCKNISSLKTQLKDVITQVYINLLKKMEVFQPQFDLIINSITAIDLVFAKATIALHFNYCKPEIAKNASSEKSFVNAKGIRHCLIEHIQQNEIYVANDIFLGSEKQDGILLYGTNAVGKTCLIRALGIAVIMAQSGLYVPCSAFQFSPYKTIFTRILGNDNIFKGLSTFAVEMSELRTILRLADQSSLILGDELCSGTESISAISIFVAGIKQLYDKGSSFIFATHLHEIVNYEEICALKTVVLKHMAIAYDKERDLLIYDRKLQDGPGENMYGLEVCKSLNLPEDFLTLAHTIRMKYFKESGSILSLKSSHFNSKKIVAKCEMCAKEMGTEVHHLQHQNIANEAGIIHNNGSVFHKNHPANLITVCDKCHDKFHKTGPGTNEENVVIMHKKAKTSKGYKLTTIK